MDNGGNMRKLFMLIMASILLMGAIDTIYVNRVDLFEPNNEIGFDHAIWSHSHQDSTLDTNQFGEVITVWSDPIGDSVVWNSVDQGTLFVMTPIEVGKYNLGAVELIYDCCSLRSEYFLAALHRDFDVKPWEWRLDTALTCVADSFFDRALLCDPFNKWFKYRLIDIREKERADSIRTIFIRLKFKESG